jgi:lipoyl(octanoyl) transferase
LSLTAKPCYTVALGQTPYAEALQLQLRVCEAKKSGFSPDVLLLLEHPPTITLGRNGRWANLVASEATLRARGVSRFEVDRGGDITFHGPGQLVGYPLLKLESDEQDVRRYMRTLEESLIRLLRRYGITASRAEQYTGVWTDGGKIAAMGVHISRWTTRHGFALNVNTDLSFYDLIVPCGISGKGVTSMQAVTGRGFEMEEVARTFGGEFSSCFNREILCTSRAELEAGLDRYARQTSIA